MEKQWEEKKGNWKKREGERKENRHVGREEKIRG